MRLPLFRRSHALAVDDCGCWTGPAPCCFTAFDVKRRVDAVERPVPVPQVEIIINRALWRQIFRDRAPLAAGAEDVEETVDHFSQVHGALGAAALAWRKQRLDMRPFLLVGHIAGITQLAAVVATTIFVRSTSAASLRITSQGENHKWLSGLKLFADGLLDVDCLPI